MPDRDGFFQSFDEAWASFAAREHDLADSFAPFPEAEHVALAWLVLPEPEIVTRAQEVQRAFARLDWVRPLPAHFLHVSIATRPFVRHEPAAQELEAELARGRDACAGLGAVELEYRRVGCFHDAVVVEVECGELTELAARLDPARDLTTFLPHLTVAMFDRPHDPAPLREALAPLRDAEVGGQRASAVTLCLVPVARSTILTPWRVVGAVQLRTRFRMRD